MIHYFNSSTILDTIKDYPGHPLLQILILNEPTILSNLLPLVTTKPSSKINSPTGIPPHVKLLSKLSELLNMFQEERQNRRELQDKLSDSVKVAIEETAIANGTITRHSMSNILDKHQKQIDETRYLFENTKGGYIPPFLSYLIKLNQERKI